MYIQTSCQSYVLFECWGKSGKCSLNTFFLNLQRCALNVKSAWSVFKAYCKESIKNTGEMLLDITAFQVILISMRRRL